MTAIIAGKGNLTGLLSDLALTTDLDKRPAVPVLAAVHLYALDGFLHGWSTDRYRMGHARVEATGDLEPINIFASDVKDVVALLRQDLSVSITRTVDKVEFSNGLGSSIAIRVNDCGEFPQLPSADVLPNETAPALFNAAYLEAFAKIGKRRKEYIDLFPAPGNKPSHIRIGDDYRAWLMPLRPAGQSEKSWLGSESFR